MSTQTSKNGSRKITNPSLWACGPPKSGPIKQSFEISSCFSVREEKRPIWEWWSSDRPNPRPERRKHHTLAPPPPRLEEEEDDEQHRPSAGETYGEAPNPTATPHRRMREHEWGQSSREDEGVSKEGMRRRWETVAHPAAGGVIRRGGEGNHSVAWRKLPPSHGRRERAARQCQMRPMPTRARPTSLEIAGVAFPPGPGWGCFNHCASWAQNKARETNITNCMTTARPNPSSRETNTPLLSLTFSFLALYFEVQNSSWCHATYIIVWPSEPIHFGTCGSSSTFLKSL